MSHNKMVVKKRVIQTAESMDVEMTGTPAYQDLMQNVENHVQQVLEEEGILEF